MDTDLHKPKGVGLRRKQLQCPFTWGIPVVPDDICTQEYAILALASDTWSLVLSKLFLAYQFAMKNEVRRSKKLLVECYLPLLEVKGFVRNNSDLITEYRTALKHVIDSTWAFVCCKTIPVKEVGSFLESITPYPTMTDFQKSAVWAIRGRLVHHEDGLRATEVAISLNPTEGQWHLYRGLRLHQYSTGPHVGSVEELKALEESYCLRLTPESLVAYAMAQIALTQLLHQPHLLEKGVELLRQALVMWPNSPYVNFECGIAFQNNLTKQEDLILAERCLRNAVRLVEPGKCKFVYIELGKFLINYRDTAEGKMYLQMAEAVNHE